MVCDNVLGELLLLGSKMTFPGGALPPPEVYN